MIVNAYGVLAIFVALVEALGAGVLAVVAVRTLRASTGAGEPGVQAEARRSLLFLLALLACGLSLASLPLWGVLLQSYVPHWDGVLCITGVLRVGTGSAGAPGWLPGLAQATTVLHSSVLALGGSAALMHLAGRDAPAGTLPRRQLTALLLLAVLAAGAAATETAYIVIPKTEQFLASGCCTTRASLAPQLSGSPLGVGGAQAVAAAYSFPALLLAALFSIRLPGDSRWVAARDVLRVAGAALVLALGWRFVVQVVAPAQLGLPLHHCAYCLVARAPETLIGIGLLVLPVLAALWTAGARLIGAVEGPALARLERRLDRAAMAAALGALGFFAVQWAVT